MKPPPTLAAIARLAGVSQAAASFALRNQPGVSAATRERIQRIAREQGYQPHPYLSYLMANRGRRRREMPSACLAWIDGYPDDRHLTSQPNTRKTWLGFNDHAREHGFVVERFSVHESCGLARRLDRILKSRGIQGVVLGNTPELPLRVALDWKAYSAVAISHFFQAEAVDRVMSNAWQMIEVALDELSRRGYRRIGLALPHHTNEVAERRFTGAYLDKVILRKHGDYVPPCLPERGDQKALLKWVQARRPDAIIFWGMDVLERLQAAGWRIPEEIGLVQLAVTEKEPRIAGVDQNARQVGTIAADSLARMVMYRATGLPRLPRIIYVGTDWRDGWTVRAPVDGLSPLVLPWPSVK